MWLRETMWLREELEKMADKMDFDSELAAEYDKGVRRTLPTYDALLRLSYTFLRSHLTESASLLIVGGGGGNELKTFGPDNPSWKFTAVDPSAAMLKVADMKSRQLGIAHQVELVEGTITAIPEERIYDGATCLLVLHFVVDVEEKLALLEKVRSHLKPGSPFVIASKFGDPKDPEFRQLVTLWKNYWLDNTNMSEEKVEELMKGTFTEASISEEKIRMLLTQAGFHRIANFFKTNHFGGWICQAE